MPLCTGWEMLSSIFAQIRHRIYQQDETKFYSALIYTETILLPMVAVPSLDMNTWTF